MSLKSLFFIASFIYFASPALADTVPVISVVDGDTIVVNNAGKREKVRLIGIDTPESRSNPKALRDADLSGEDISIIISRGKKATAFVKTLLKKGDHVTLELDVQERDRYGRILAYVYLSDGRMLNEIIIGAGYAGPMTVPPNVKHQDTFLNAYKSAREKSLGLWSEKNEK